MTWWMWFAAGLFVGSAVGVFAAAVLAMAGDDEEAARLSARIAELEHQLALYERRGR